MNRSRLQEIIAEELLNIAPEAELDSVAPDNDLREELDLDSLDYLNLVIAINHRLHIQIPEADYGRIASLSALLDYLEQAAQSA
jgi:acyl carrier protein